MPGWQPPQSNDISHKLRHDFARKLMEEHGERTEQTDPILSVLFRSVAAQVAGVYEQAKEAIPLAVLDELMMGLGMPERRARAAQTVMKFNVQDGVQVFEAGTLLKGEGGSREVLTFALDTAVAVTKAQVALAAIYQDGALRLHQGTEVAKAVADARPAYEAVPAELGASPALFLAVDVDEDLHLSHHGFYFELDHEAKDLLDHLRREVWCLMDGEGGISAEGLLRPLAGNAGARRLNWLRGESRSLEDAEDGGATTDAAALPEGYYGNRVFVFPEVPPERRFLVKTPKKMEAPLRRIFQSAEKQKIEELFEKRRAWLRIGLPRDSKTVAEDLIRVVLHCATASNIEVLNQTIDFAGDGTAIPMADGGGRARHLVNTISIRGERGEAYMHETELGSNDLAGRYRFRQGRVEFTPARTERGVAERRVNVRLALTNGELGNSVGANKITTLLGRQNPRTLEIRNLNSAAGGSDGELFGEARERFTNLLLSRERPVTYPDLEAMVKAFEPKIRGVKARSALERRPDGLHRVQRIAVALDRESFALADVEAEFMRQELEAELQKRSLLGMEIRVVIEWIGD